MDFNPPFLTTYENLINSEPCDDYQVDAAAGDYCELPLIDLSRLNDELDAEQCKEDILAAAMEWGFFQIVNHGVPQRLLARLREEQIKMFQQSFMKKTDERLLDFDMDSYRWGTPSATSLKHLSWSEAYHIPLSSAGELPGDTSHTTSGGRHVIDEVSEAMSKLGKLLVDTLAQGLGVDGATINDKCTRNMCYLRLNRYPPCPIAGQVFGLVPHTDSDFITILHQDKVVGLQLNKGGKWFTVKPNTDTLVINIGDLFQAWSNGMYKSVQHRVMTNPHQERFSVAYFVCPSKETVIQSNAQPAIYKKFSFGEYRQQVQQDVRLSGSKVGLTRFLA